MSYQQLYSGIYPGNTYVHFYSLNLSQGSNVFLEVGNDNGTSAIYDDKMGFVSKTTSGAPIYLEKGDYTVIANYSSPTNAVLNVYFPSETSYGALTELSTGSYQAKSYDNFYKLDIETGGRIFLVPSGDNARATIYDKNLNFVIEQNGNPLYLSAGEYVVLAQYNGFRNGVINANIPSALQVPNETGINSSGLNFISGVFGAENIVGSTGLDVLVQEGNRSSFVINKMSSGWVVSSSAGGIDTLANIERLQFADKKIALDLTPDGNAGKSLEFIGMVAQSLVNQPSVIGTILSIFDQGKSMHDVCQLAIDVGLINQLAGSASNLDLAKLVFRNVVGSEASAATASELAGYIQGNGGSMTQADFLATVAQLDLNNQHIGLVGLQQTGAEYTI